MKRILIVRTSAMGDIIMASQVLPLLHARFPGVTVDWLVENQNADLLRYNPRVRRLILWDKSGWRGWLRSGRLDLLLSDLRLFFNGLRRENYDLVLDLQGLLRTRVLTRMARADERWGFASKEGGDWLLSRIVQRGTGTKIMGDEYLYAVRQLGVETPPCVPDIVVPGSAIEQAAGKRQQVGVTASEEYFVLAPFTTRPQKHWRMDRWAPLAVALHQAFGCPSVVLGGPADREAGLKIAKESQGVAKNLAGETSLIEALATVQGAKGVIGVDTGLTHLGHGFQLPTVALFGSTCPYLSSGNETASVLYSRRDCSPCKRNPTCDDYDCMTDLSVDMIVDRMRTLIEGGSV